MKAKAEGLWRDFEHKKYLEFQERVRWFRENLDIDFDRDVIGNIGREITVAYMRDIPVGEMDEGPELVPVALLVELKDQGRISGVLNKLVKYVRVYGGMKITVESTNASGATNAWGYVTMFDGEFRPVEGQENATTAVEVVDERTTRILNARNGEVYQVILNVLSEDGNTIENEYIRVDAEGRPTRVSHATYDRIR